MVKMVNQGELGFPKSEEIDEELKDEESKDEELKGEEYDSDSDDSITEEGYRLYGEFPRNSSGFDVPVVPCMDGCGMIQPYNHTREDVIAHARLTVDEYNRRYKDGRGELQFVRVLKVTSQLVNIFRYFVTFKVVDMSVGVVRSRIFRLWLITRFMTGSGSPGLDSGLLSLVKDLKLHAPGSGEMIAA